MSPWPHHSRIDRPLGRIEHISLAGIAQEGAPLMARTSTSSRPTLWPTHADATSRFASSSPTRARRRADATCLPPARTISPFSCGGPSTNRNHWYSYLISLLSVLQYIVVVMFEVEIAFIAGTPDWSPAGHRTHCFLARLANVGFGFV